MKKSTDPKEADSLKLLLSRKYNDELGIIYTPYLANEAIPNDEWKAMEYLALYKGYNFKNKKVT